MDAEVSRPRFTTSIDHQVEAREAFDAELERQGKQRVTKNSFGKVHSVEGTKKPARIEPKLIRSVEIQVEDESGFFRSPHQAKTTEPEETKLPDPAQLGSSEYLRVQEELRKERQHGW